VTSSSNCNGDVKTFRLEDIIECVGHVTSIGDTDMAWQLHRPPTSINDDTEITGPDNDGLEVEQSKQATEAYHGQYEAEIEGHCGRCRRPFTFLSFSLLFIFFLSSPIFSTLPLFAAKRPALRNPARGTAECDHCKLPSWVWGKATVNPDPKQFVNSKTQNREFHRPQCIMVIPVNSR